MYIIPSKTTQYMSRLDLLTVFIVAVCLAALGFLVYKTVQLMNPPELDRSSVASSYDLPEEDSSTWMNDDSLTYSEDNTTAYSNDEDLDDEQVGTSIEDDQASTTPAGSSKPAASPAPAKSSPSTSTTQSSRNTPTTTKAPSTTTTATKAPSSTGTTTKPATTPTTKPATTTTTPRSTTTTPRTTTTTPRSTTTTASASTGRYSVVAGSFGKRANADSHASRLRKLGYASTEVVAVGQFASVVVNRFNSLKDAENLVLELRGKGVEAFVKTRQ